MHRHQLEHPGRDAAPAAASPALAPVDVDAVAQAIAQRALFTRRLAARLIADVRREGGEASRGAACN